MTIAFFTLIDELCIYAVYTYRTIPNKSHLGEGLETFSTRENCHPLSHWNRKIVSGMTYLPSKADERILWAGVPPTDKKV